MKNHRLTSKFLVAHRGYQAKYPENTQLSLLKAIEAGASYIELDVQFSADKQPIIYHDIDLQRVSGIEGYIYEQQKDQLLSTSAHEPGRFGDRYRDETIAALETLTTLLTDNPHVTAFVELKEESIEHCGRKHIIESVSKILQPVAKQTVVMSFDYKLALIAREINWPAVGLVLKNWGDLSSQEITAINPDYIFTNHLIIPPNSDLRHYQPLANTQLVAYEVGDKELAISLINQGVDMLETFNIAQLLRST